MLFEIRNYHFNPDLFDGYKTWAKAEALPYLSQRLDIVGFWLKTNDPPEIGGEPQDKLGSANVTWIIRWRELAHRNDVLPRLLSGPEWQDIRSRVPGGRASYLRTEVKFAEALVKATASSARRPMRVRGGEAAACPVRLVIRVSQRTVTCHHRR